MINLEITYFIITHIDLMNKIIKGGCSFVNQFILNFLFLLVLPEFAHSFWYVISLLLSGFAPLWVNYYKIRDFVSLLVTSPGPPRMPLAPVGRLHSMLMWWLSGRAERPRPMTVGLAGQQKCRVASSRLRKQGDLILDRAALHATRVCF